MLSAKRNRETTKQRKTFEPTKMYNKYYENKITQYITQIQSTTFI